MYKSSACRFGQTLWIPFFAWPLFHHLHPPSYLCHILVLRFGLSLTHIHVVHGQHFITDGTANPMSPCVLVCVFMYNNRITYQSCARMTNVLQAQVTYFLDGSLAYSQWILLLPTKRLDHCRVYTQYSYIYPWLHQSKLQKHLYM